MPAVGAPREEKPIQCFHTVDPPPSTPQPSTPQTPRLPARTFCVKLRSSPLALVWMNQTLSLIVTFRGMAGHGLLGTKRPSNRPAPHWAGEQRRGLFLHCVR